jgi:hypothetical protein
MVEIGTNLSLQDGETNVLDNYEDIPAKTISIEWDTDGMDEEELDLPTEVEIPIDLDEDRVSDWLSDMYGFCVKGWYEI